MEPLYPMFGSRAWEQSHPRERIFALDAGWLHIAKLGEPSHPSWMASLAMSPRHDVGVEHGKRSPSGDRHGAGADLQRPSGGSGRVGMEAWSSTGGRRAVFGRERRCAGRGAPPELEGKGGARGRSSTRARRGGKAKLRRERRERSSTEAWGWGSASQSFF